jgi:hypothetical protein
VIKTLVQMAMFYVLYSYIFGGRGGNGAGGKGTGASA